MFPRLAALAACACLFLLGAVPTGAVYVTTLPSSADVWLDGIYIGHSPVVLDALSAGRHTVSLNRTGWVSQDIDVSVVAGTTALACVALVRAGAPALRGSGSFTVKGVVPRSLLLDGALLLPDKTGMYFASSGSHELVAQTAGGKITRNMTIYPDMRTDIVLRTDQTAQPSAVVAPATDYLPVNALKVDGAHLKITYEHHVVEAMLGATTYRYDGRSVNYDAAPTLIGAALYLPLELLKQLTANDAKAK
jgi:hypothetical protein